MSAQEWLGGKDGVPAKIDLESVYEGNAPVEVAADYKPPTPAPVASPAKAPAPKREEPPSQTQRASPPTMSEQKGSISAMASKFQDDEAEEEDGDETSSFEEIQKPVQKHIPTAAKAESKPSSPSPTKTEPPNPAPISQVTPRSTQPPFASQTSTPVASSAPSASTGSSNSSVDATLQQIKSILEAQTKTITAQSEKIGQLAQEVDTLKMKVGGGSRDQSERIRQLELELEAARS